MEMQDFSLPSFMLPSAFRGILSTISFLDVLDILLVSVIFYKTYEMLEDTRAITLVKGIMVILMLAIASSFWGLHTIFWILQNIIAVLVVAIPVVFQPELRRALEHIGQGRFFAASGIANEEEARVLISELVDGVCRLSEKSIGALIVIERSMGLKDLSDKYIKLDALVTSDLLMQIFVPNTPLHDGAIIIRGNRIASATVVLPLTENNNLSSELGTRHRAAIGISEQCDALVIVVSEETGTISVAEEGRIYRHLDKKGLRNRLVSMYANQLIGGAMKIKDIIAAVRKWGSQS